MRRRNGWDRHYAMPTDVHSSEEASELVRFALLATAIVVLLGLARVALAGVVEPFSAFTAVSKP